MAKKSKRGGFRENAGNPGTKWSPEALERNRERRAGKVTIDAADIESATAIMAAASKPPAEAKDGKVTGLRMAQAMMQVSRTLSAQRRERSNPYKLPAFPPDAIPPRALMKKLGMIKGNSGLALDSSINWASQQWTGTGAILNGVGAEGLAFLGYPFLSELAQRPEYRTISETIADDATRKWIDFEITGAKEQKDKEQDEQKRQASLGPKPGLDKEMRTPEQIEQAPGRGFTDEDPDARKAKIESSGKMEKVKAIQDEMARLDLRDVIYANCRDDGFFGRSHLYLNFGEDVDGKDDGELMSDIGNGRDTISIGKVSKDRPLKRVQVIEPVWVYPLAYNANNPMREDFYKPQVWYVLGRQLHISRALPFIGHPVPDLLKPSYSFGGISLSQLAMPYVDIWLQTRNAVGTLIHSFSVMVLKTDLQTSMQPGGDGVGGLLARAQAFNMFRDNQGLFLLNMTTEDFTNVSASLSGLHELQAQSQEHMASVARIPLVKLTGISPTGLNASSEGEMMAYYDTIAAYQNRFIRPNLTRVINFIQLGLFGEIDPEITFEFEPLRAMSEKEKAELQKSIAERDQIYVDGGAISPEEWRKAIIDEPDLPYADLDPADVPELKQEEQQGLIPPGAGKAEEAVIGEPGAAPGAPGAAPGAAPAAAPAAAKGGGEHDPAFQKPGGAAAGDAAVIPFREGVDPLFAGDAVPFEENKHPRDPKGEFASKGSGGSPKGYGWHAAQKFQAPQYGLPYGGAHEDDWWAPPPPAPPLDPAKLKKVGAQMGSNPGGVFEDENGDKFYIKKGQTKDHVRNELTAASLYHLAGAPTLEYVPVEGDSHIATFMEKLDKNNANKLSEDEIKQAKRDFVADAWLANYDSVGTGGDNLVTIHGHPVRVDLGGALDYRARGKPKGDTFGNKVGELDSMRDPKIAPDASKIFGDMTPAEFLESAQRVTRITDGEIKHAVEKHGGPPALAAKLIARRDDIAERAKTFGADGDPKKKTSTVIFPSGDELPVDKLNGIKFEAWKPPADGDWNEVEGQADLAGDDELPETVKHKQLASGVVIREKDGRVWMARPANGFGGYIHTFPKGRVEPSLSMQANAIKEAFEETGLKTKITGLAGDREGDVTFTRYYMAERVGGDPSQTGKETEGVVLAPASKLNGFLNRARDLDLAAEVIGDEAFDWEESKHPRDGTGEFSGPGASSTKEAWSRIDRATAAAREQDRRSGNTHHKQGLKALAGPLGYAGDAAAKRTLYVNRPLLNAADLIEWAHRNGIKKTLPAEDIHVTLAFSKTKLVWPEESSEDTVLVTGGRRDVELLGDKGAAVLRFESDALTQRWRELKKTGAVWDYPQYKPHVTITYDLGGVNLADVEPYMGELEFGQEEFDEVDSDWADKVKASLVGDAALAGDAWEESKHPRGNSKNAGQFGSGGSGAGKPQQRRGGGQVRTARSAGGSTAVLRSRTKMPTKSQNPGEALQKAADDVMENADSEQKGKLKDLDQKCRKFFSSPDARKATASAVASFAKKHAAGMAAAHLNDAIMLPVLHSVVETAVNAVGFGTVPGITLAATTVAAYTAHHLMKHFNLSIGGAKELLVGTLRNAIDVLGGVKEVSARIAAMEGEGKLAGDAARSDDILDALLLLLLAVEELGEEDDGAKDQALDDFDPNEARDPSGKWTSGGGSGASKEEEGGRAKEFDFNDVIDKIDDEAGKNDWSTEKTAEAYIAAAHEHGMGYSDVYGKLSNGQAQALTDKYGDPKAAFTKLYENWAATLDPDQLTEGEGIPLKVQTAIEAAKNIVATGIDPVKQPDKFWTALSKEDGQQLIKHYGSGGAAQKAIAGIADPEAAGEKAAEKDAAARETFKNAVKQINNAEGEYAGLDTNLKSAEAKVKAAMEQGLHPADELVGASFNDAERAALDKKYGPMTKAGEYLATAFNELAKPVATAEKGKKTKFGGLWKQTAGTPMSTTAENADILFNAEQIASKKQIGSGSSYRQMLAYIIKNADAAGVPISTTWNLKAKLVQALYAASDKASAAGKEDEVKKIGVALGKIAGADPAIFDIGMKAWEAAKNGQPAPVIPPMKPEQAVAPKVTTLNSLSVEYNDWLKDNNFPASSADELLMTHGETMTPEQKAYVNDFITKWQATVNAPQAPAGGTAAYAKSLDDFNYGVASVNTEGGPAAQTAEAKAKLAAQYGVAAAALIEQLSLAENKALKDKYGTIAGAMSKIDQAAVAAAAPPPPPSFKNMSDIEKYTPGFAAKLKQVAEAYKVASKNSVSAKLIAAVENGAPIEALKVSLKPAEKTKMEKKWGSIETAYEKYNNWYGLNSPNGKAKAIVAKESMPIAVNPGAPTDSELAKAKKTVALQIQYVPNAPQDSEEAHKLVAEFNKTWADKAVPDDATAKQKIADFKAMQAKMVPLMNESQKKAAEKAKYEAEHAQEIAAAAAAKIKAETAKHEAEIAEYKKELGISDAEAEGFEGLVSLLGKDKASLINEFKNSDVAGHGISKFEGALIGRYKSSSSIVNEEMRKGLGKSDDPAASWQTPRAMFAKVLNKALSKLPGYKGVTIRNTPLSSDLQKRYVPGSIVWEHGFTGTSKKPGGVFSGNTRFYITSTGKRAADISNMHGFHSEEEVLFQANTPFHVDKVEGSIGQSGEHSYNVYMTELEPW